MMEYLARVGGISERFNTLYDAVEWVNLCHGEFLSLDKFNAKKNGSDVVWTYTPRSPFHHCVQITGKKIQ